MGGRILLAAVLPVLALAGCVSVKVETLGPGSFADKLEKAGIGGEKVTDARCRKASEGWSYVCTYARGRGRKGMAFRVDVFDNVLARSTEFDAPDFVDPADEDSAAFVRRADQVCARRNAVLRGLSRAKNRRQALANVDRALAAERLAVLQLQILAPPQKLAGDFAKLIEAEHKLVKMTEQGRRAMQRGDEVALSRATSIAEADGHVIAYAARRLGLTACGAS